MSLLERGNKILSDVRKCKEDEAKRQKEEYGESVERSIRRAENWAEKLKDPILKVSINRTIHPCELSVTHRPSKSQLLKLRCGYDSNHVYEHGEYSHSNTYDKDYVFIKFDYNHEGYCKYKAGETIYGDDESIAAYLATTVKQLEDK